MKIRKRIETILAFGLLALVLVGSGILTVLDRKGDVYPTDKHKIRLYGEAHGSELYYGIEFHQWQAYYDQGYRNLFLEIPYYSAAFLNLWMQADQDEILNQLYAELRGTQSGVQPYYAFLKKIKANCPETVFYGTDVGHQNQTTGARYLAYLEASGQRLSVAYQKTLACIRQGEEYRADDAGNTGLSAVREGYLVKNFIECYDEVGGNVMGIYGSYHTELQNPERMAGQLRAYYGDIISSLRISTIAFGRRSPYQLGLSATGIVFLLMLLLPKLLRAGGRQPRGYREDGVYENWLLRRFERAGQFALSSLLPFFVATEPRIKKLPEGVFFEYKILLWGTAFFLMFLYEGHWLRYFFSRRTVADFYRSLAGFPLAGATLPVLALFLLSLYSCNLLLLAASLIFGVGHIGIHLQHYRAMKPAVPQAKEK